MFDLESSTRAFETSIQRIEPFNIKDPVDVRLLMELGQYIQQASATLGVSYADVLRFEHDDEITELFERLQDSNDQVTKWFSYLLKRKLTYLPNDHIEIEQ